MYSAIFLVLLALANVVAPIGFLVGISYQAPLVSCNGQDISFDWEYISSTGIPPDTSRWFYKSTAGDIELMYTLQSNTEGRPTQLYTRRVMVERRTQMHGTGITLRNVSQNDNGLYFVELSFRLEFTLKLVSNEDNGTSLTVIDCPKETPKIHKFENRTIQCSSSKSFKDLKLAIFKDGEQQTTAFLDSDDLILNVDNSSHGDYYCGYIYPSKPFVNIIGTPSSSIIHIKDVDPSSNNQYNDKKKGKPLYIILISVIAAIILCVLCAISIVLGIVHITRKKNKRSRHRGEENQEHIHLQENQHPANRSNERTPCMSTSNDITSGCPGSGEPTDKEEHRVIVGADCDSSKHAGKDEIIIVHKGKAFSREAYTDEDNIETGYELDENAPIGAEVQDKDISLSTVISKVLPVTRSDKTVTNH